MIVGIGTDLTEIDRVERSMARFGDRFLERIFSAEERRYSLAKRNSAESFAARFAAKEAGAKALGTGISRGVGWQDFEVFRAPGRRPELHLHGRAAQMALHLGVTNITLSLTHTRGLALAVVLLEAGA